jgi:hypothetical protein
MSRRLQVTLRQLILAVAIGAVLVGSVLLYREFSTAPKTRAIQAMRREAEDAQTLEGWQKRAIGLARSHLEAIDGKPVDATFTAKREARGERLQRFGAVHHGSGR